MTNSTLKLALVPSLLLTLSLTSPLTSAEGVYKWTDEAGVIHYSDKKPNDVDAKNLKIRGHKTPSSAVSDAAMEQQKSTQLEAKAQALQESTAARENDAQCQAIRDNLKKIQENSRVKINDNGELRYLSPEEIEEKKNGYQDMLDKHCQN